MYREAGHHGCEPQPGLSLLRMAEGRLDAAAALIRGVTDCPGDRHGTEAGRSRARLLGPCVDILIATSDLDAARAAADELAQIATASDAQVLLATSARATGAVLLAEGDTRAAVALLREAWAIWQKLDVLYESARTRVLIGLACQRQRRPRVGADALPRRAFRFQSSWAPCPILPSSNG